MQVKYDLVVDFARPSKSNTIIISEGDVNSRVCHFTLLNNKQPMSMGDVTVATVRGVKSDGSVIYGDATILEDEDGNKLNEVEYTVPASISDEAGNVTMTITLLSNQSEQLTSFEFYLLVRNALYNEDDLVSESDLSGFRDLLNRCLVAVEKIEAMTESTTLPNPYPLNINLEGDLIQYTGSETKEISINDVAYISELIEILPESADESAAGSAAESAEEAAASAEAAAQSASNASSSEEAALNSAGDAHDSQVAAAQSEGMCEAYKEQARQLVEKLSLPTEEGTYQLVATLVDDVMTYSWSEV